MDREIPRSRGGAGHLQKMRMPARSSKPLEEVQLLSATHSFVPHAGSVDQEQWSELTGNGSSVLRVKGTMSFSCGLRLAQAGCDQSEIASILRDQAKYAYSPD